MLISSRALLLSEATKTSETSVFSVGEQPLIKVIVGAPAQLRRRSHMCSNLLQGIVSVPWPLAKSINRVSKRIILIRSYEKDEKDVAIQEISQTMPMFQIYFEAELDFSCFLKSRQLRKVNSSTHTHTHTHSQAVSAKLKRKQKSNTTEPLPPLICGTFSRNLL